MERSDDKTGSGAGGDAIPRRQPQGQTAGEELLAPGEVAELFGVDPKTVSRWADAGKLRALRTLGGHRRYRASEVHDLLDQAAS